MNAKPRSEFVDDFTDEMSNAGTAPCDIHAIVLPENTRDDIRRLALQARFEPERAFVKLLQYYAEEPLRTQVQVFCLGEA